MKSIFKDLKITKYLLLVELIYLIFAIFFSYYSMERRNFFANNKEHNGEYGYKYSTYEALSEGRATLPFQYRVLIPYTAAAVKYGLSFTGFELSIKNIVKMFEFITFLFSLYFYRYFLKFFFKDKRLVYIFSFSIIIGIWSLIVFGNQALYPYDVPTLLFWVIGCILIYKNNLKLFYPFFILATLQRETSIFMIVMWVIVYYRKIGYKSLIANASFLSLIWLIIKIILIFIYKNNPAGETANSGTFYFVLGGNLFGFFVTQFTSPKNIITGFYSMFGFSWILLIIYYSKIRNEFIRKSLFIYPLLVIGMFFVGSLNQIRQYVEVAPIVVTAVLLILYNLIREAKSNAADNLIE